MFKTFMSLCFAMTILIHQVYGQTACAAEANFQGCKTIQETKLSTCGPVDFSCQCAAHRLIQECYNLCPGYATDAVIHDGTVQSICSAVPASSSLPLPSATSLLPSSVQPSVSAASASASPTQQQSGQSSSASTIFASVSITLMCSLLFGFGLAVSL